MIRATHSVARLVAMVVVVGAVSGVATAQPTKAPVEPTLKGPEVKDRNVPGVDGDFGMGAEKRKYAPERIPPEVFRKAVQSLSDPNAPAEPVPGTLGRRLGAISLNLHDDDLLVSTSATPGEGYHSQTRIE